MEMKVKEVSFVDPKTLKPYERNRNKHSEEQIERLVKLIEHHGFRDPLIVSTRSKQVIAGNGRLMAALKMDLPLIPVSFQEFASDDEEYTFHVSHNAIADWAELDYKAINSDLPEIGPIDINVLGMKDFKIDPSEIDVPIDDLLKKKVMEELKITCPYCGNKFEAP